MLNARRNLLGVVALFALVASVEGCDGFEAGDEDDGGAPPGDVTSFDARTEDARRDDGSSRDQSSVDRSLADQQPTDHVSETASAPDVQRPDGGAADVDAAYDCCSAACRRDAEGGAPLDDAAVGIDADATATVDAVIDADSAVDADSSVRADAPDVEDSGDGSSDVRPDRAEDDAKVDAADAGNIADSDGGCACAPETGVGNISSLACYCEDNECPTYDVAAGRCPASKFWIGNRIETFADCNLVIVTYLDDLGYSEHLYDNTTHAIVGSVFTVDTAAYLCGSTPVYGFRGGATLPEHCTLSQTVYRCGDGGSAAPGEIRVNVRARTR